MRIISLLLLLLLANDAFGINIYKTNDTLFVWSKSGLTLRDTNSFSGKKLLTIPYGTFIISNEQKVYRYNDEFNVPIRESQLNSIHHSNAETISPAINIKGRWLSVKFQNQEGFVFDGYLSHYPPPSNYNFKFDEFIAEYLKTTFKLISKTDISDDKIKEITYNYGGGISCHSIGFEGSANGSYYIPNLSFDEILLLLLYSEFIGENPEYLTNKVSQCTHTCSRKITFKYCCALQTITITEIGRLTILEFMAAC